MTDLYDKLANKQKSVHNRIAHNYTSFLHGAKGGGGGAPLHHPPPPPAYAPNYTCCFSSSYSWQKNTNWLFYYRDDYCNAVR